MHVAADAKEMVVAKFDCIRSPSAQHTAENERALRSVCVLQFTTHGGVDVSFRDVRLHDAFHDSARVEARDLQEQVVALG